MITVKNHPRVFSNESELPLEGCVDCGTGLIKKIIRISVVGLKPNV
jgi:hypothetical protein